MKKVILLLSILLLVGCSKSEISLSDFTETASFNGYVITSSMEGYEKYNYINDIIYAVNREDAYYIQFIEINNSDLAKKFFDINKEEIEKYKTSNSYVKSYNRTNNNLYHLENDSDYMLVIRLHNNIIYIDAPINYINEIEEFLSELNIDY